MHSLFEAGPLVRAAVDTAASVASQVASNAMDGKPLGDGVGMAALSGAAASVGLGAVVEAGGAGVARLLGRGVEDAEGEAATVAHDVEGDVAKGDACGLSFAANTPVTLADGGSMRPIAALKTGDMVLAYDPSTGKARPQPVEHVFVNHDANLVDVTLVSDGTAKVQAAPVASDGKARDAAAAAHGTRAPPSNAGDSADASQYAKQRSETIHTTTNHPWYTADHGWLPAGFLQVGERVVRADGTTATVVAVRAVAGAAEMWDLTVGTVHDFAVGNGRYVVHNCGGASPDRAERVRQSGYQGKGTGAGAVAENADGTVTAEDFSHSPTEGEQHIYDVEGHTNGGRCAETWCADAMGAQLTDGNRGSKITMYMSHRRGDPPCMGCQRVLSQLAADNGADVELIANGADRWIFQPDGSILR